MKINKEKLAWLLLLPLILLEVLYFYQNLVSREVYLASDNAVYAILAKRLLEGDIFNSIHTYWNPGFPLATIPFYLITKSWETAQILVSMTATIFLIITSFVFFKRVSLIFALIVAFLTTFSASLQGIVLRGGITEPLYIFLLWAAIYFSWLALKLDKLSYYIYCAIFFSLAYLTRTEALPIIATFLLVATVKFLIKMFSIIKNKNLIKSFLFELSKIGAVLFIFVSLNIPYIAIQSMHIGRLTFSGKYAYVGSGPYYALEKYRPTTWAQDVWAVDFNYFKSPYYDPERATNWMVKYFKNGTITKNAMKSLSEIYIIYQSINTDNFFSGWGLKLGITGFLFCLLLKEFRKMTLYFFLLWIVEIIWVATFMVAHYRYLVFAIPLLIFLQGASIYVLSKFVSKFLFLLTQDVNTWLKRTFVKDVVVGNIFLLLSVSFFLQNFFFQNMSVKQFTAPTAVTMYKDYKVIADWIKSNNIGLIGGRMEGIELYSGAKIVYMPSEKPEIIVDYMKKWGVEYLLVRPLEVGYAHVAPIANPNFKHPDLTLIKRFEEDSLIWKVGLTDEERLNNQRTFVEKQWNNK